MQSGSGFAHLSGAGRGGHNCKQASAEQAVGESGASRLLDYSCPRAPEWSWVCWESSRQGSECSARGDSGVTGCGDCRVDLESSRILDCRIL